MHRCIAITGGTGFIGRRLARKHLANGDDVRILSRSTERAQSMLSPGVTVCEGNLADRNLDMSAFVGDVDILYHCAAELNDESCMRELHVDGTRRLVSAAEGRIGLWIQLSSVGVYGARQSGHIDESAPECPVGEYEKTKAASDRLVIAAAKKGGLACHVVRPSIVYGHDMPNRSLHAWIDMIRKGYFFFIGKPGAIANYVHVDDVVDALLVCGSRKRSEPGVYNVSQAYPLEEFVAAICNVLGVPMVEKRIPFWPVYALASALDWLPGFPLTRSRIQALTTRALYVPDRICDELGFRYQVSLRQGMTEMVESMK